MLNLLKNRHEIATAIDVYNFNIYVGLYSKYLLKYKQDQDKWVITEILKFDSPILAMQRGDIFGINQHMLVVLTINSIHVIST